MSTAKLRLVTEVASSPRSAALRYPGAKWSIAGTIVSYFGDHYHYAEPFFRERRRVLHQAPVPT